jgi:hypothetical protein
MGPWSAQLTTLPWRAPPHPQSAMAAAIVPKALISPRYYPRRREQIQVEVGFAGHAHTGGATLGSVKALPVALVLGALAAPLTGCGGPAQSARVTYEWTRTPGVVFVVVHPVKEERKLYPSMTDPGTGSIVDPRAEYVLLCDARRADGMHCELASEAGVRRYSYTPKTVASAPVIELPVGSIPGNVERVEERAAPEPAAAQAPPAPPAPPPPPPPAPGPGGKKP